MEIKDTSVMNAVVLEASDFMSKTGKDMFKIKLEDNSSYTGFGHTPVKAGDIVNFTFTVNGIYNNVKPEDILKVVGKTVGESKEDTSGVASPSKSFVDKSDEILWAQCINAVLSDGLAREGNIAFKKRVQELYAVCKESRMEIFGK
jgi:hypothetical protein